MALANTVRRTLTNEQRTAAVKRMRSSLVSDWVQTQLMVCRQYQQAALGNWLNTGGLGYIRQHEANWQRYLEWCRTPTGLGLP